MRIQSTCAKCGASFSFSPSRNRRYCSRACAEQARTKRIPVSCVRCGTLYSREPAKPGRFCSRRCASLWQGTRRTRTAPELRFWPKVNKAGPIPAHLPELGPCHEWTGSRNEKGYGQFNDGTRVPAQAHVFAYVLAHGPVPAGFWVLHKCDNPPCVRDSHLWLGTAADNTEDMMRKGRHRSVKGMHINVGESHGLAKLTEAAVLAIRADTTSTDAELAQRYGVTAKHLRSIRQGKLWRHLLSAS